VSYRAVLFDLGGVVVGSPLHAIAAFERECGIADGFVNRVVVESGPEGAWSRLERGELGLEEFYPAFEQDCTAAGSRLDARELMVRVAAATGPRPAMLEAIRVIRARGLRAGAITNNWIADGDEGTRRLRPLFDAFVESAVVGIRKPDPRIYRLACDALGIAPPEAVFLDDIGGNLKAARALGMATIKVAEPDAALAELAALLGFPLREERDA
jgi:putative hydrolase of the HAD superfamily